MKDGVYIFLNKQAKSYYQAIILLLLNLRKILFINNIFNFKIFNKKYNNIIKIIN